MLVFFPGLEKLSLSAKISLLFCCMVVGFFLMGGVQKVSAASAYAVTETSATVGTATNLEMEYTVDILQQTWVSGDTLTVTLPSNFPAWSTLTFSAEYDSDVTNNGTGETAISAGSGNGQYAISGQTITIKWNLLTWGVVTTNASTVRILVTGGAIPQYEDTTSTFTWGGSTVSPLDGNPSGSDNVNVAAADAAASVTLAENATVGTAGNTTLALTLPVNLTLNDTVVFTMPANLNVNNVAFGSDTFAGAGAFTCADAAQVITCTASGAITGGTAGTIVMTGITSLYAASSQTVTTVVVNDGESGGSDMALDASGTVTDTAAGDAAASVSLAGNATVGGTGNTTLAFTIPVDLAVNDTVVFTMPANLDVNNVAFGSDTFGGAGAFACADSGQVITCSADGAISAGTGTIVMTGITSLYAASSQTVTNLAVNDTSVGGADISADASGTVTDTVAGDAAASVTLAGNATVGAAGNTTLTFTLPSPGMANTDTVVFTMPVNLNVSSVAFASETFDGGGTFSGCVAVGQIITCTANGVIAAGTGTIVMTGITSWYAATSQTVTSFAVNDTSASGADIASDASGTVTNTVAADAAASVTLGGNFVVGVAGNTTLTLTLPVALAAGDTIVFTLPNNLDVSSVAFGSETFAGAGTLSGCSSTGQIITCTTNGVLSAGTGNIVMSGIEAVAAADNQTMTNLAVNDTSAGGADIATDASGTVTDTIVVEDAVGSITLGVNTTVGLTDDMTLTLTLPSDLAVNDVVEFTAPGSLDVSLLAYESDTFGGAGFFVCADSGQVVSCTANGAITAGTGSIVMSTVTAVYAAAGQTVNDLTVFDDSLGVIIAADGIVPVPDIAAAALTSVSVRPNSFHNGVSMVLTVIFTSPLGIAPTDTVRILFPAGFNVTNAAGSCSTIDGSFTVLVDGQTVTLARNGDGTLQVAAVERCVLMGIRNPLALGLTAGPTVQVTNAGEEVKSTATALGTLIVGNSVSPIEPVYVMDVVVPDDGAVASDFDERFDAEEELPVQPQASPSELVAPSLETSPFDDIEGHLSAPAILELFEQEVVEGREEGAFYPDELVIRAELVKVAFTLFDREVLDSGGTSFPDVVPGEWYYGYLVTAEKEGIINGYHDGLFRPERTVTRAEALKIFLLTAWDQEKIGSSSQEQGDDWYVPYVTFASLHHISREEELEEDIHEFITRAEMADMATKVWDVWSQGYSF